MDWIDTQPYPSPIEVELCAWCKKPAKGTCDAEDDDNTRYRVFHCGEEYMNFHGIPGTFTPFNTPE